MWTSEISMPAVSAVYVFCSSEGSRATRCAMSCSRCGGVPNGFSSRRSHRCHGDAGWPRALFCVVCESHLRRAVICHSRLISRLNATVEAQPAVTKEVNMRAVLGRFSIDEVCCGGVVVRGLCTESLEVITDSDDCDLVQSPAPSTSVSGVGSSSGRVSETAPYLFAILLQLLARGWATLWCIGCGHAELA